MYNQYSPYMNRFYGQQQVNLPQPMDLPQQPQNVPQMGLNRAFLNGKQRRHKRKKKFKNIGRKNNNHKLSEKQVKEIYFSDLGCTVLSKLYNVSKTNIRYIKKKKQWKWLTDTLD